MNGIVETTAGQLRGDVKDDFLVFRGVPFAAPAVGPLRFLPPQPVEPWSDVRDARRWGGTPPQPDSPLAGMLPPQNEDCLTLNVWTPAADDARRPVMVWIHGGGFTGMAASSGAWRGGKLVRLGDVVVVTVEYRLGALGFLHLGDRFGDAYAASGNNGILDQVAALEWVRDNVAAFGGDPANVTVFGESAGGMSIGSLLGMPAATGLFHKAVPQSGAAHTILSAEDATAVADRFLEFLGIDDGDHKALLQTPVERLLEAQTHSMSRPPRPKGGEGHGRGALVSGGMLPFSPVVDGLTFTRPPLEAVADGHSAGIPLLVGTCKDEWRLFSELLRVPTPTDPDKIAHWLEALLGDEAEQAAKQYLDMFADESNDKQQARFAAGQAVTDVVFEIPALRLAEAHHRHGPTWLWRFDWETPFLGGNLGACHGVEISFVFGPPAKDGFSLAGSDQPEDLTAQVQRAWIAFARTGDPNHDGIPDWPVFDPAERPTLVFDTPATLAYDPSGSRLALWDEVL